MSFRERLWSVWFNSVILPANINPAVVVVRRAVVQGYITLYWLNNKHKHPQNKLWSEDVLNWCQRFLKCGTEWKHTVQLLRQACREMLHCRCVLSSYTCIYWIVGNRGCFRFFSPLVRPGVLSSHAQKHTVSFWILCTLALCVPAHRSEVVIVHCPAAEHRRFESQHCSVSS